MPYELIAVLMFSTMMLMLLTGQRVFGAIGFTWEMKNHRYYKRARANSELLGSPRRQREEVISMVEAGLTA